jgi:hypothetical protein
MRINLESRLRKLESSAPSLLRPSHRVIGDSRDECNEKRVAMIEAGQAEETDDFVFRIIVTPGARSDTLHNRGSAPR